MTVDTNTGEITEPLTGEQAGRLTDRIRMVLTSMLDRREKVLGLIAEAKAGGAHQALGYASWTDYVKSEFAGSLPRLSSDERKPVVTALSDLGMSTRAIAPVVGVGNKTVHRDLGSAVSDDTPQTPEPTIPQGEPVSRDVGSGQTDEPEVFDAELVDDEPARLTDDPTVGPQRITGTDGKSYPKPTPKSKPKRSPLPDSYQRSLHDAQKRAESLYRLTEDNRYNTNRQAVTQQSGPEALRTLLTLGAVVTQLDPATLAEKEETRQWWLTSLNEITDALHGFGQTLKESA